MTGKVIWGVVAGLLGGLAWLVPQHSNTNSPLRDIPPLEYFVSVSSSPSFSEVQNAKSLLKADCLRSLSVLKIGLVAKQVERTSTETPSAQAQDPVSDPVLRREFVEALRKKIQEASGVEQECLLYQELLNSLKSAKLDAEWLDTYLNLVYQRPTLPLVARFADTAAELAVKSRRTDQVCRAFTIVVSLPVDIAGKNNLEALLNKLSSHEL